jgi:methionyl-tRNA synthetase
VLGNFVNRVTKFCVARFDGQVPGEGEYGEDEKALIAELDRRIAQYAEFMETAEFRKALGELRAIWVAGNEYMTRAAPWTHIKTDRAKAAVGVRMGLNLIHQFAHLIWPVMPSFARTVHECIQAVGGGGAGYRGGVIPFPDAPMAELLDDLTPGQPIKAPEVLVAKITEEQVAELKARFGGVQ